MTDEQRGRYLDFSTPEGLLKWLSVARNNIANARQSGLTGYLAGWEHQVIDAAIRALRDGDA